MVDADSSASERERVRRIRDNYDAARERAVRAAARAGRRPDSVRMMAVTKNFPRDHVLAAVAAGLNL